MKKIFPAILIISAIFAGSHKVSAQSFSEDERKVMCQEIKEACQFAWEGYKTYAWGADALKPISRQPGNWYSRSLLMTPVDAYDTFILMGMQDEAREARDLILDKLSFDLDAEVQVFEVTIRLLGALITAYENDGDARFLELAKDLGRRLMPAFGSPTGMPYRYVNLATGRVRDSISNPAEIGTLTLEFGKLTSYTGDSAYYKAVKKAVMEVFRRRSALDLLGTEIDIISGQWKDPDSHISGMIDSYYEYLFKAWLLFGDPDFKNCWEIMNGAVKSRLLRETPAGWYFTHVNMNNGQETAPYYGALDAFYAGLLALSGDTATAARVQRGNFHMWTRFNMEPEIFDFAADTLVHPGYPLRPENIESCFYLHYFTHDDRYLYMGKRMTLDILKNCRTNAGYAAVRNVRSLDLNDSMESFFFAETLKYAYLLFAPQCPLDLSRTVFNTEAHPFRILKK